jgi:pimeloyl-ACP methyl ester carboxylesterase
VWHSKLGFCHAGFLYGMDDVLEELRPYIKKGVVITGHSLGGAHARILAGLLAYEKFEVGMLCVFGSPKPAFINLARIIQKSGMQHFSYRNRNDVVPDMPLSVFPFFDFQHTEAYTPLDAAPSEDNLEPLRDHSIKLYYTALCNLEGSQVNAAGVVGHPT